MQGSLRASPWSLLFLLHAAWAALRVSVPQSPIRAGPFSDLWLPCNFSDPSRPINLGDLSVAWKRGEQTIALYDSSSGFTSKRPEAEMPEEQLRVGNASLLLRRLQDADSGVYKCLVLSTPEKAEGSFELRVEAEPRIVLGSTKLQLAKRAELMCTVSGFYPSDVSVEWLKDGVVVKGLKTSLHWDSQNGLYNASSILELTPDVEDANANFSCRVGHKSLESPLEENFQLQLQALPRLEVSAGVSGNTLEVLECLVSGFYPQDVQVRWLRDGIPQTPISSVPEPLPDRTFFMRSLIRPQERDPQISYVCQVQHKTWDAPLEMMAPWQPKEEGDGLPCRTPQRPQISGMEGVPCECSPVPIPTSPTSAAGYIAWPMLGVALVIMIILAGVILYHLASKKRKRKSYPDSKNGSHLNPEPAEVRLKPEDNNGLESTVTLM